MSKQKQKGTGGENEVKDAAQTRGFVAVRTPPGVHYDVQLGHPNDLAIDVLATRPDYGRWLATVRLEDLLDMMKVAGWHDANIEVKRYRRFSLHSIWTKKFGAH